MKWIEISIHTSHEATEPISNILHESGASGVVIEDALELTKKRSGWLGEIYELNPADYPTEGVIVKAYLSDQPSTSDTIDKIKQKVSDLQKMQINIGSNHMTISEVDQDDWANAWKKYYEPIKISNTFTIVPIWEDYKRQDSEEMIIEMDPGMAFGTGTHPTTILSIQALEKTVERGNSVIDVGTGSGILSIASALLGAENILALDVDEVAVASAKQNIAHNNVLHLVEVRKGNLLEGVTDKVDVIVANILAEIIIQFTSDASTIINKGGYFITSGIIQKNREWVKESLIDAGFEIKETLEMDNWVTYISVKK